MACVRGRRRRLRRASGRERAECEREWREYTARTLDASIIIIRITKETSWHRPADLIIADRSPQTEANPSRIRNARVERENDCRK
ncbi:unnamed protein product [Sphagnum balticum]